jgi:ABC-type transport system involved in multi-copper enzyme maturation permease subunit
VSAAFSGGRVGAIALNTFREAVRNRAFIAMSVVAVAFIAFSVVLSELAVVGQGPRVVLDFGFFAISLFCVITGVVMGAVLLQREVSDKTIYTILSKPVPRYELLAGKYLGMLGVLGLELVVLTGVWLLVLFAQSADAVGLGIFKGLALIFFELSLVGAVAVMFSAMSSPLVTAVLSTGVFVVGRLVYVVEGMLGQTRGFFQTNPALRPLGEFVTAVFPDLSVFNISQHVLLGVDTPWAYMGQAFLYAAGWSALLLVIGVFAFHRRDFV